MSVKILKGDCLAILPTLAAASIDAVVTDPPYELTQAKRTNPPPVGTGPYGRTRMGVNGDNRPIGGFMGKEWDGTGIAHSIDFWREVHRVMKPGAHLLAFGGTRTYHRLACAVEDAGFEIRDQIQWLYGSGFPKSRNIGDGRGTALKPAHEPIVLARKPLIGTVAANAEKHGTGALNIDACRLPLDGDYKCKPNGRPSQTGLGDNYDPHKANKASTVGRWPANVVHDGSDEVIDAFPVVHGGSAARFFYSAKASKADRAGSKHPTVKPIALMQWLCRLVTPPGGVVLDPFAGSGTTGMACLREVFDCILIERETEYVADIERRVAHVSGTDFPLFRGAK